MRHYSIHHVTAITISDINHGEAGDNGPEFWSRTLLVTHDGEDESIALFFDTEADANRIDQGNND